MSPRANFIKYILFSQHHKSSCCAIINRGLYPHHPQTPGPDILGECHPAHHTTQMLINCRLGLSTCHHQPGNTVAPEAGCQRSWFRAGLQASPQLASFPKSISDALKSDEKNQRIRPSLNSDSSLWKGLPALTVTVLCCATPGQQPNLSDPDPWLQVRRPH